MTDEQWERILKVAHLASVGLAMVPDDEDAASLSAALAEWVRFTKAWRETT
jgi:hypothetical protein